MYCTPAKVREANELLNDIEIFSDEMINPFIEKSQTRIDTVLSERYRVPLNEPIPGIIQSIAQDMSAGFVLTQSFANRMSQEMLNLGNSYLKRAEADLTNVVNKILLDGLPGIELAETPSSTGQPAMATTTPAASPIEELLKKW